jgi:hypothetical protein
VIRSNIFMAIRSTLLAKGLAKTSEGKTSAAPANGQGQTGEKTPRPQKGLLRFFNHTVN